MFRFIKILALICALLGMAHVFAQDDLATYTSSDGTFTFQYPSEWEAGDSTGYVVLSNLPIDQILNPDYYSLNVGFPTDTSQYSMMGMGSTPLEITRYNAALAYQMQVMFSATPDANGQIGDGDEIAKQLENLDITEYEINGYPAARTLYSSGSMMRTSMTASTLFIAAEVGGGKIVTVQAISLNGEGILLRNQHDILAIARSIKYSPLPPNLSANANPALPQTYSGPVGVWGMGSLKFNYPDDWYVIPLGPFVQNTPARIDQRNLLPGQLQIGITGPEFAMMPFASTPDIMACKFDRQAITASSFIQKNIPSTPEQLEQVKAQGIVYEEPEFIQLNGHDVAVLRATDAKRDILVLAVDMGDGYVIPLMAFAPLGEMVQHEPMLLDVVETFEFTPNLERCTEATPTS